MKYYVDQKAEKNGNGSPEHPFACISEAAKRAVPGDEILVAPGIYREEVDPKNGGTEKERITYTSIEKGKAVITGAEVLKGWKKSEGNVYTVRVPNSLFQDRNPYTTYVSGDWLDPTCTVHLGDVFLNDRPMYEVTDRKKVSAPEKNLFSWDPDFSVYVWYCEQEGDETVFYANFQGKDPNEENVEISVRKSCFTPAEEGIGYITLSGFTICKAAAQWAPPTAYQEGMIAPHWSKGWIIEDCEVYGSKCVGISLGKYYQPENDNKWLTKKTKDGTQTERDAICQAVREGWNKANVGSHVVRHCDIHDCGQAGIVGHMGCAFSLIEENHIHHINNKQDLLGAEIGGIKFHAAIDTIIRKNRIHDCSRGLWLDWQAQGTRVTQNLFYNNCIPHEHLHSMGKMKGVGEDLFVEVAHGPTLIDNNIFLSYRALKLAAQGIAVVHNLIMGSIAAVGKGVNNGSRSLPSPRYTPYHVPHDTAIAGFMTILHGDVRFYNNLFIQQKVPQTLKMAEKALRIMQNEWEDMNATAGLKPYDRFPTYEEWIAQFEGYCGMNAPASDRYYSPLPVWAKGNVYFNGADKWKKEEDATEVKEPVEVTLREEEGKILLSTDLYEKFRKECERITSDDLGEAFEPEQRFEDPEGNTIFFDTDYCGEKREKILPGPFAFFEKEKNV